MGKDENISALITAVQSHQFIWDKTDRDYKNATKKDDFWRKIANECEFKSIFHIGFPYKLIMLKMVQLHAQNGEI